MRVRVSDFGFNQSAFSGVEQVERHTVFIRFHSGGFDSGFLLMIRLNISGTASKCKYELPDSYISPKRVKASLFMFMFTSNTYDNYY